MSDINSHVFPFLRLPTEIRLKIYGYCLPSSHYYENNDYQPSSYVLWERGICPCVVYTNRNIYREAIDILYEQNRFSIPRPQETKHFNIVDRPARIIYNLGNRVEYKIDLRQCQHLLSREHVADNVRHLYFRAIILDDGEMGRRERELACLQNLRGAYLGFMEDIGTLLSVIPRLAVLCVAFSGCTGNPELDPRSKQCLLNEVIPGKPFSHKSYVRSGYPIAPTNSGIIFYHMKPKVERFLYQECDP